MSSAVALQQHLIAKDFRDTLIKRYSCVRRAWNMAIDTNGMGRLGFFEFCNSVREMGYDGNLKLLWEDINLNDTVSVEELDPRGAKESHKFKKFLIDKFGNVSWF